MILSEDNASSGDDAPEVSPPTESMTLKRVVETIKENQFVVMPHAAIPPEWTITVWRNAIKELALDNGVTPNFLPIPGEAMTVVANAMRPPSSDDIRYAVEIMRSKKEEVESEGE